MANELNIKIGGEAGFGIMAAGDILARSFTRSGYHAFVYSEYPSLIRGGHNTCQVRAAAKEVLCQKKVVDILVALNYETITKHADELAAHSVIILNSDDAASVPDAGVAKVIKMPMDAISGKLGSSIYRNVVALGACVSIAGLDLNVLRGILADSFAKKGEEMLKANYLAAEEGWKFMQPFANDVSHLKIAPTNPGKRFVVSGNHAAALGAIRAGMDSFCEYPMTPVSSILHFLAEVQQDAGILVRQPNDEIEAMNSTIGSSYAGVRAMTASSGGGFSLMVEGLGLAAMTETPIVVIEGQRPGPATSMPTWGSQGDLQFVLHAAQGEFPRIIAAPGDANEAYSTTARMFDLAYKYQVPGIVLLDKFISEGFWSVDGFEDGEYAKNKASDTVVAGEKYVRYAITKNGVSPRAVPGKGSPFFANSDEHTEQGFSTEESELRSAMDNKRFAKVPYIASELPKPILYGPTNADITIVGWGSIKGPALEALEKIREEGISANFLHVIWLNPFPSKELLGTRNRSKLLLLVENNLTAQFGALAKEMAGLDFDAKLLKDDGRPFYPEEIAQKASEVLKIGKAR